MPKSQQVFLCEACGYETYKWLGKCPRCAAWDTFREVKVEPAPKQREEAAVPIVLAAEEVEEERVVLGMGEMDRVLGGGLTRGSSVLLGGDPGIGKTTLCFEIAARMAELGFSVLYVSGEESLRQLSARKRRLAIEEPFSFLATNVVEDILQAVHQKTYHLAVIDSIQSIYTTRLPFLPGSASQIREVSSKVIRDLKKLDLTHIFIGHVTKEGAIAGPKILEHMVDTVLYFEGDSHHQYRIVRAVKNRFGPSGEIALFSMTDRGLREVSDPSELFVINQSSPQIGSAVVPIVEGTRILLIEVQSLVNRSPFGMPQRVASGINPKRLSLLLAVLERYGGLHLGDQDVFFNIAGGLSVAEPAVDLGAAASILSSFRGKPLRPGVAFLGELGLGGEVRPVNKSAQRIRELARRGFKECILPEAPGKGEGSLPGSLSLVICPKIAKLPDLIG